MLENASELCVNIYMFINMIVYKCVHEVFYNDMKHQKYYDTLRIGKK